MCMLKTYGAKKMTQVARCVHFHSSSNVVWCEHRLKWEMSPAGAAAPLMCHILGHFLISPEIQKAELGSDPPNVDEIVFVIQTQGFSVPNQTLTVVLQYHKPAVSWQRFVTIM